MNLKTGLLAVVALLLGYVSGDAQQPVLKFNNEKKFKIVQFTDLHVKYQHPASEIAFERMNQVLDDEKPDLVIFTGDIIYSSPAEENLRNVLKTVSDRSIPFSVVFGNHDDEQGVSNEILLKVAQSLPHNLSQDDEAGLSGSGNYILPILSAATSKEAALLYCFDSHAYSKLEGIKGYDYIKSDQVEWYKRRSREYTVANGNEPLPALAFFHIPLPEYREAMLDENASMYGIRREKVCSPAVNSGMFLAMKEQGDVLGTFVGHDHDNDYAVYWQGILLAYGRFTGGPTEYTNLPNGARVIELTEGSKVFRTWIRTAAGIEQLTVCPDDYIKK